MPPGGGESDDDEDYTGQDELEGESDDEDDEGPAKAMVSAPACDTGGGGEDDFTGAAGV